MASVYFGGSRSLAPSSIIPQVIQAVVSSGSSVHVGCQLGADLQVVQCAAPSSLVVFAVASYHSASFHVRAAAAMGAQVHYQAGGKGAPFRALFLLRSIAAFQGCSAAVFFSPGPGSLAVAREAVSQGLPVFAFGSQPAPIPQQAGAWVPGSFMGFSCWSWSSAQLSLL